MAGKRRGQVWSDSDSYEAYMGRWSREVARRFIPWLAPRPRARWLDVGCGSGALSGEVIRRCSPALACGIDPSAAYLHGAAGRHHAVQGDARELPFADQSFDFVVSGLVLNFVPDAARAVTEMVRVTGPGGSVAVYVWDYSEGMQMLRYFWQAATEVDSAAARWDETPRFTICRPEELHRVFASAGVRSVAVKPIEVAARFASFDDYWRPFLRAQGPAGAYLAQLDDRGHQALRGRLERSLPVAADGSIDLVLRAWAARGTN